MPPIASHVAAYEERYPASNRLCTASTTIIALSTTVPMASTNANNVRRLIENPATAIKANVPMMETKMEMVGINVERKSCKNKYTTKTTNSIETRSVMITSLMEAFKKRLVSLKLTNSNPLGKLSLISDKVASISPMISEAFVPAVW